jgi:hypothetical protein
MSSTPIPFFSEPATGIQPVVLLPVGPELCRVRTAGASSWSGAGHRIGADKPACVCGQCNCIVWRAGAGCRVSHRYGRAADCGVRLHCRITSDMVLKNIFCRAADTPHRRSTLATMTAPCAVRGEA